MFVKGVCANPKGRPKGSKAKFTLLALTEAIKRAEVKDGFNLFDYFIERARENDAVLLALLKKFIPDAETVEELEEKLVDQTFEFENMPKRVNGKFQRFYN